jgi:serine/threonine protein kinase
MAITTLLILYFFGDKHNTTTGISAVICCLCDRAQNLSHQTTQGVSNRDIKLENVVLNEESPPRAMLCDFGK